ncbi:kinesin-like protein KIF15, partial [Biomphalaria glabrata]
MPQAWQYTYQSEIDEGNRGDGNEVELEEQKRTKENRRKRMCEVKELDITTDNLVKSLESSLKEKEHEVKQEQQRNRELDAKFKDLLQEKESIEAQLQKILDNHYTEKSELSSKIKSLQEEKKNTQRSTISSLINFAITCWYGNTLLAQRLRLNRLIKKASHITQIQLPSLEELFHERCLSKTLSLLKDNLHPLNHCYIKSERSGRLHSIGWLPGHELAALEELNAQLVEESNCIIDHTDTNQKIQLCDKKNQENNEPTKVKEQNKQCEHLSDSDSTEIDLKKARSEENLRNTSNEVSNIKSRLIDVEHEKIMLVKQLTQFRSKYNYITRQKDKEIQ